MQGAGFTGRWNELDQNHRMPNAIVRLARELALQHLESEAELLPRTPPQLELDTDVCLIDWRNAPESKVAETLIDAIHEMLRASRQGDDGQVLAYADICVILRQHQGRT